MNSRTIVLARVMLAAVVCLLAVAAAKAENCPPGAKSCKVVTVTPEEAKTLNDLVFPAALWANRTLTDLIEQWKNKIAASPDGEVKAEPKAAPSGAK